MYNGWGDARKASLSGTASGRGQCTTDSYSFPPDTLEPANSWVQGESYYTTTATAAGAVGLCDTTWRLTFTNPGYPSSTTTSTLDDIRCDNAVPGAAVGCVVFWYAPAVNYSRSRNPTLASHVERAQGSGLPGATFDAPLVRTTDPAVINENRARACGDAPRIAGKSCDEYPLASTRQGLTAGGERRTFTDCSFTLPSRTGPTGVSVCMIAEGDNNAQGGLQSQLYLRERVLDGDPFRVVVIP